jgi:hypothetical protein
MIHELQLQGARRAIRASNSQLRRKLRCLRHQEFVVVSRGLIWKDRALIWGGPATRFVIESVVPHDRVALLNGTTLAGAFPVPTFVRASDEPPRHCGHSP